jgi:two-component system sensor histidine kinase KdpD
VYEHRRPAGQGTSTFNEHQSFYLPLQTAQSIYGVLGVQFTKISPYLTTYQYRLLKSFATQSAQAIERVQLAEEARQAQLLRETEKLQTALLNSISHDLRTPLASITGALSSLRDDAAFLNEAARHILVSTAWEQADHLNNLLGNLLQMTRLEAGGMKIKPEPCDIQDLIGVALAQLGNRLDNRPIDIQIPDTMPLVSLDMVLMVQVLVNILDNALKYSPPQEKIIICANLSNCKLTLQIIDNGPGIPNTELKSIFDKFYRLEHPTEVRGTGLGLSISKGIVEAHEGRIWAENKLAGGAIFKLTIPVS